jgi:hypothetical protein
MKFHGDARFVRNEADGYLSLNSTVYLSVAFTADTTAYAPARGESTPVGGKMILSYVALMSSDVMPVPSWNLTSWRSLIVTVVLSAETAGCSAATSGITLVRSFGSNL